MIVRPLTEYCTLNMGQSPDSKTYNTQGKGLPFYQGNADFGETHPITHVWCSAPVKVAEDGDILISVRAPIGVMNMAVERCCIGRGLAALTPIRNKCSKQFLYYALQSKVDSLIAQGTGSTFKAISKKVLEATCIPAYSTIEQEQIAETIGHVDNTIAARRKQLALLDQLVKSRFIELFGDPMTDVSKWSASTIGEQFNVSSGGTPATGEKAYWENGTIPWIGSNMCQDTMLSENDGKFITEEGYAHSSAKWFHKGTVLVALVGATIGKTALLRFDTTTNQNIAAIDVTQNAAFSSEFVFYHMQMLYSKFMEIGSGKFKMANQGFIRQLPLICPPIELQEQFAAFVEQTDKSKYYSSLSFRYCQAAANTYRQEWMTCRTSDF